MNAFPPASQALGRFKGGIVRLAFHDAAEFKRNAAPFSDDSPVFRADGCVDLANPGNAGLDVTIAALDSLWAKRCSKISRADYWYYAAKVVIEESTPYIRVGDPSFRIKNFSIPFFAGRIDRTTCSTAGAGTMLPGAEGGHDEIKRTMIDNLGLDVQHTTALLGAHCLGGASPANSGYNLRWTFDPHLFTTQYFQSLLLWGFDKTPVAQRTGLTQWDINNDTSSDPVFTAGIAMLTNDLALMYDMSNIASLPKTCGAPMPDDEFHASLQPGATTPAPSASKCPYLRFKNPSLNFEYWVRRFADGSGPMFDGPGAESFLPTFSRAFAYIGQLGYQPAELTCTVCRNANTCSDASCSTADVQCGTKNRYAPPTNGGGGTPPPPVTQPPPTTKVPPPPPTTKVPPPPPTTKVPPPPPPTTKVPPPPPTTKVPPPPPTTKVPPPPPTTKVPPPPPTTKVPPPPPTTKVPPPPPTTKVPPPAPTTKTPYTTKPSYTRAPTTPSTPAPRENDYDDARDKLRDKLQELKDRLDDWKDKFQTEPRHN